MDSAAFSAWSETEDGRAAIEVAAKAWRESESGTTTEAMHDVLRALLTEPLGGTECPTCGGTEFIDAGDELPRSAACPNPDCDDGVVGRKPSALVARGWETTE